MAIAVQPFEGSYKLDGNHSSFQFSVTHLGLSTFRASFADIDARLLAEDDGTITLVGHARADSISIDDPDFRAHVVRGTDFFDADAHPLIVFRSTSIELGDDRSAVVAGELEIGGASHPVTATGTYAPTITDPFGVSRAALDLSATVDRRDWEMSWQLPLPDGGDALGWEVEISAGLELVKEDA
ncbi:MAG: YceI family protein [Verrucomicrobiota bacterium]